MTSNRILKAVMNYTGVNYKEMARLTRKDEHVFSRYLVYYLHHEYTSMSLSAIGLIFMQDSSNVYYAIKKVNSFLSINDKQYTHAIKTINTVLNSGRDNDGAKRQNVSAHPKQANVRQSRGNSVHAPTRVNRGYAWPALCYSRQSRVA